MERLESRQMLAVSESSLPPIVSAVAGIVLPPPRIASASDSGASNADGYTAAAKPVITGSAPAHAFVQIAVDGSIYGTVRAGKKGSYSFTPRVRLPEGRFAITAQVVEDGQPIGVPSPASLVTLDRTQPRILAVEGPASKPGLDGPLATTFRAGDVLRFVVRASEPVGIGKGVPSLRLRIGAKTVQPAYAGRDGSDGVVFTYTVRPGDTGAVALLPRIATAVGGRSTADPAIRDRAGNPLGSSFVPPDLTGLSVDTVSPGTIFLPNGQLLVGAGSTTITGPQNSSARVALGGFVATDPAVKPSDIAVRFPQGATAANGTVSLVAGRMSASTFVNESVATLAGLESASIGILDNAASGTLLLATAGRFDTVTIGGDASRQVDFDNAGTAGIFSGDGTLKFPGGFHNSGRLDLVTTGGLEIPRLSNDGELAYTPGRPDASHVTVDSNTGLLRIVSSSPAAVAGLEGLTNGGRVIIDRFDAFTVAGPLANDHRGVIDVGASDWSVTGPIGNHGTIRGGRVVDLAAITNYGAMSVGQPLSAQRFSGPVTNVAGSLEVAGSASFDGSAVVRNSGSMQFSGGQWDTFGRGVTNGGSMTFVTPPAAPLGVTFQKSVFNNGVVALSGGAITVTAMKGFSEDDGRDGHWRTSAEATTFVAGPGRNQRGSFENAGTGTASMVLPAGRYTLHKTTRGDAPWAGQYAVEVDIEQAASRMLVHVYDFSAIVIGATEYRVADLPEGVTVASGVAQAGASPPNAPTAGSPAAAVGGLPGGPPRPTFLALHGGGLFASTLDAAVTAGTLDYLRRTGVEAIVPAATGTGVSTVKSLFANVDAVSANSGGAWFATMLAHSEDFVADLETGADRFFSSGYMGQAKTAYYNYLGDNPATEAVFTTALEALIGPIGAVAAPLLYEQLKHDPDALQYVAALARVGRASWQEVVSQTVFQPYGMSDTLRSIPFSEGGGRTRALANQSLLFQSSISAAGAAIGPASGLAAELELANVAFHLDADRFNFTPTVLSSIPSTGRAAPPALPLVPGSVTGHYDTPRVPFGDSTPVTLDGSRFSFDVSAFTASAASSAALAGLGSYAAFTKSLWWGLFQTALVITEPVVGQLAADTLANTVLHVGTELAVPVQRESDGAFSGRGAVEDRLSTAEAAAHPILRLADGGYTDNTSVSSLLQYMHANGQLTDGFSVTLIVPARPGQLTADPVTGFDQFPASVNELFGGGDRNQKQFSLDTTHATPRLFSVTGVTGLEPRWRYREGAVDLSYRSLGVTTDHNPFGLPAGIRGTLNVLQCVDPDVNNLPLQQPGLKWDGYERLFAAVRHGMDYGGGAVYFAQALGAAPFTTMTVAPEPFRADMLAPWAFAQDVGVFTATPARKPSVRALAMAI